MYQIFVGFYLTHRDKWRFYEFEPWLIGFNSISAVKKLEKLCFLGRRMGWGENPERIGRLA
jgi:hypothetical protein